MTQQFDYVTLPIDSDEWQGTRIWYEPWGKEWLADLHTVRAIPCRYETIKIGEASDEN